ncbi:retrovirus-related pol polyprotein from transposon TNT 1-94 [Tanacetum coccineum]
MLHPAVPPWWGVTTLVIVDEYSRMVENKNDVKVKQIRTDNGTEFRNHELESFCDENFSSPYTHEQNCVAERRNKTLIEAARTMLNGSVLSKHFWTEAVRIAYYTRNRSIIDHLGKFDAKADNGYFLGYSFVSKAFRVFNTRRQQVEETYHVAFDESMEAIRFTNTSVDEIGIGDSSKYLPDEFLLEDDPSRRYQVDFDVSYYILPYGRSLTELTQENHIPEVIAPNEPDIPHTEDTEGPPDLINTEGTHEQNVQNDQIITQPTDIQSGNNTKVS